MKKQYIVAIGIVALAIIGFAFFRSTVDKDPMVADTQMTTEMAKDIYGDMTEDMTEESMAAGESMKDPEMMKNDGKEAPAFDLVSTKGETISLESLKGERVYVKFWASWCSICLAGLEEFDELSANAEGFKAITIVSPGYSGEQSRENFIKWFDGLDYDNMVVLLDDGGKIAKAYGVRGYPTSVYIGSDGIMVKQLPGHVSNMSIEETFKEIY